MHSTKKDAQGVKISGGRRNDRPPAGSSWRGVTAAPSLDWLGVKLQWWFYHRNDVKPAKRASTILSNYLSRLKAFTPTNFDNIKKPAMLVAS